MGKRDKLEVKTVKKNRKRNGHIRVHSFCAQFSLAAAAAL